MAVTKEKKRAITGKLADILKEAKTLTFVQFKNLDSGATTELRKNLASKGIGYLVLKKTLLYRGLQAAGFTVSGLDGNIAIAYGTDVLAPIREVFEFQKTHKDNIALAGGIFEGQLKSAADITALATIPDMPVLRGMFVNVINSPIQSFVIALGQIAEKKGA